MIIIMLDTQSYLGVYFVYLLSEDMKTAQPKF